MRIIKIGGAILLLPLAVVVAFFALPIVGVVWGARQLATAGRASDARPGLRGKGAAALAASLVFALVAWPMAIAAGGGSAEQAMPSPTASAAPTVSEASTSAASRTTSNGETSVGTATAGGVATARPGALASTRPPSSTPSPALLPVAGVVDGDTLRVRVNGRTERVRLIGIDTPELASSQCHAREAASAMQSLAQARSVRLEADPTQADRDRYGRLLRHVVLADGRLAAEVLITGGHGRVYAGAAGHAYDTRYRAAETKARGARLGVWSARCATSRVTTASSVPRSSSSPKSMRSADKPSGSCRIKGNINSKDEKIYHVPGSRSYEQTKLDTSKGERWFCTESEARSAGWRAPKR